MDDTSVGPDVQSTITERGNEQAAADVVDDRISGAETSGITNTVRYVERGTPVEGTLDRIDSNDIHAVVMGQRGDAEPIEYRSAASPKGPSAPLPVVTVGGGE